MFHRFLVPKKPFRILSLDGGGVRAIIQSILLGRLLETHPLLLEEVDMIAGTSAGGILAISLAMGKTPNESAQMWEETAPKVFVEGYIRRITSLYNTLNAVYNTDFLREMVEKTVGQATLQDVKKKLFIPAFKLDSVDESSRRWTPEFFHNLDNSVNSSTPLVDIALRTGAAPTFFPIYQGYIDGGTFANNPSLAAVTAAIHSGVKAEDIVVLSLSTGNVSQFISKDTVGSGDWGLVSWAPHIIDLLMDSTTQCIDYSCRHLMGPHYCRVDIPLQKNFPLDQADAIPELKDLASKFDLKTTEEWLDKYWMTKDCKEGTQPNSQNQPDPIPSISPSKGYACNIQ